jgi:putative phosphoribosyl transferase
MRTEPTTAESQAVREAIEIPVDGTSLNGDLALPVDPRGLVVFAHGSGSSRLSPRNRFVAEILHRSRLATLLMDLLSPDEESVDALTGHLRFDIDLLAERVVAASDWVVTQPELRALPMGYFGASTGAAAALVAAAQRPQSVGAVVSRGGRPDLAREALSAVAAPTLLIVGGRDHGVIELNQAALDLLASPHKELRLVQGATHLFEEPGTLDEVARLAAAWFERYLSR